MGNMFQGTANVGAPPSGELALYLDAALTQPTVNQPITELLFGGFPYKQLAIGEQVKATQSVHVWCRNEANAPMRISGNTNKPNIIASAPNGIVLQPNEVIDWEVEVALKATNEIPNPWDGQPINFVVTVKGQFLPV